MEDIGTLSWDYVALHRIIGGIDVGLPNPFYLVVARDGALFLPPIEGLRSDQEVVKFYNRCLAALLIGGIYCEAINADGLDFGSIIDWKYIRSHGRGFAAPNTFHFAIRYKYASPIQASQLVKPRTVQFEELKNAMTLGIDVLNRIPSLGGEFLLRGTTGLSRRDWGAALSNFWIVVEQLLENLWKKRVIEPTIKVDSRKERRAQLDDTRTWTASARIELLNQKGIISNDQMIYISQSRKARNGLSHDGTHPTEGDCKSAYRSVCSLMSLVLDGQNVPLFELDITNHVMTDPFSPIVMQGQPTHWLPIPKLPGEEELEKAEAVARQTKPNRKQGKRQKST